VDDVVDLIAERLREKKAHLARAQAINKRERERVTKLQVYIRHTRVRR
jgi:hypothetical protein